MIDYKIFFKKIFSNAKIDYTIDDVNLDLYFEDLELCVLFYKNKKDLEKEKKIIELLSNKVFDENGCYENPKFCEKFVNVIHINKSDFYEGFKEVLLFMDNNAIFGVSHHI